MVTYKIYPLKEGSDNIPKIFVKLHFFMRELLFF
jgi:hypothetical protein